MSKTRIRITIPKQYVNAMDELVEKGEYLNRQEIIRHAVRKLIHAQLEETDL